MSILTVRRLRAGRMVQLIRTVCDRRAQAKELVVLMCATVERWTRSRQRCAPYEVAKRDDRRPLKDLGVSGE